MKKYYWGILGTGAMANKMAEAISNVPQAELKAVASRNLNTARAFAKKYHLSTAYGSYLELVNDPELDIVYIATPANLHYSNTLCALKNNKHVLCEKPFAVNASELEQMIDYAKNNNLFLMEAMVSRFLPHIIKASDIIKSGKLGKIKHMKADFGLKVPTNINHRLFNRDLIGGSLMDVGIYPLFLTLLMLGKPEYIQATADIGETGVDITCRFTLFYPENVTSSMDSSIIEDTAFVATIFCENGNLVFDRKWTLPVPFRVVFPDGMEEHYPYRPEGNSYQYEVIEVIKCLENGQIQSSLMSWSDSLLLMQTMDSIRKLAGISYPAHDNMNC